MQKTTVCYDQHGRRYQDLYASQVALLQEGDEILVCNLAGEWEVVAYNSKFWSDNKCEVQPGKVGSKFAYDVQVNKMLKASKQNNCLVKTGILVF